MEYAYFVESSYATANSPASAINGQVWNLLEELKQEVRHELLDGGPLCQSAPDDPPDDLADIADSREIEWRHRSQLEARLRDIDDAQDRLLEGNYGKCIECNKRISSARIAADPVISLCLSCQTTRETETVFPTL
jgi:RNA polymerase-binding transcription factor DksA